MSLALFALIEEAGEAAQQAAGETAMAPEHEPVVVEWVNHVFGPAVLQVQRAILPPIYNLFGAHWHEPASGELIIPEHVVWAVLLVIVCIAGILLMRGKLSVDRPSKGQQLLEIIVEQVRGLLDQVIGPYGHRYLPVIGSFAVFILIGNLMGQVPGLGAPTESINVTGALGLTSFIYYISSGFRQQGLGYLRHFTGGLKGPILLGVGWLIFIVEMISNSVRPVTLSLRLFVNMMADHTLGVAFLQLAPWLVPIFTIVLGVFVSFVQTFIFIMLSMVYLSETVPHEEHDVEEHGNAGEAMAH